MGHPLAVTIPICGRNYQCCQLFTKHIVAPVPERNLGGGVELDDHPIVVNADNAIKRRLKHGCLASLALGQLPCGLPLRTDVPEDQYAADDLAVLAADRCGTIVN